MCIQAPKLRKHGRKWNSGTMQAQVYWANTQFMGKKKSMSHKAWFNAISSPFGNEYSVCRQWKPCLPVGSPVPQHTALYLAIYMKVSSVRPCSSLNKEDLSLFSQHLAKYLTLCKLVVMLFNHIEISSFTEPNVQ